MNIKPIYNNPNFEFATQCVANLERAVYRIGTNVFKICFIDSYGKHC